MNIFKHMTKDEIQKRLAGLEAEIRNNPSPQRLKEIDREISLAHEVLKAEDYREEEFRSEKPYSNPAPLGALTSMGSYNLQPNHENRARRESLEVRGQALRDGKAVEFTPRELGLGRSPMLLRDEGGNGASGDNDFSPIITTALVAPKVTSPLIDQGFEAISGLLDLVNTPLFVGAESYSKGFIKEYGIGDYTGELDPAADGSPEFDYVQTGKYRITSYAELSSAGANLSNPDFAAEIARGVLIALKRKLAAQIILGQGAAQSEITGILNAPVKTNPTDYDATISAIDGETLDELVFNYGGDESIEGGTWLILNKKDLAAFAKLRNEADGKKLYNIVFAPNGQVGTISSADSYGVNFVINSAVPAFVDASKDDLTMIFGKPMAYELPMFSNLIIERSTEHKFRQGIVAFRAEAFFGGTPAGYKAFRRVKKVAAQ